MPTKILPHPHAERDKAKAKFAEIVKKIRDHLTSFDLDDHDLQYGLGLLGVGARAERLLWSDISARNMASKTLAALTSCHQDAAPQDRTYYMISFVDDCGTTSDRTPHLALDQMIKKMRRALAKMDVNAFAMLEVHPLMNFPGGGAGRSLLLGAHAIAWTDMPFDHAAAVKELNASPAWNCGLGAAPVHIAVIDQGYGHMERVAHYLMKQTLSAKNLMPSHSKPGRNRMMDTKKGYRDEFALRLFEGQSQVELMNVMFGVGEGSVIRQALRSALVKWHHARKVPVVVPKDFDVWAFWGRIRANHGSRLYLPYRFDGGAFRPIAALTAVTKKPHHAAAQPSKIVKPAITKERSKRQLSELRPKKAKPPRPSYTSG
ncbi:hypothetical protein ASG67_14775 [Sphingomonas sp. Leaf339]|uniref:hypothetical protein n=1 Tax=Sphingomonas sp. Leaf339 TaxID=1736343 RepID=UPI0006FDBE7E|nr:hypothetical protein [Sphingomonas sp. Leaf339]KQU46925.1 hypothetical protein ASG67_14775 [Sphingomonas sp. Leaf339]